jgi:hypothetical protein
MIALAIGKEISQHPELRASISDAYIMSLMRDDDESEGGSHITNGQVKAGIPL